MPRFGLGTYKMDNHDSLVGAVTELGYSLLDCASVYKNEEFVGRALSEILKTKKREELYVVSKVFVDEVHDVKAACLRSLKKLGLEHLDLYMIHWPMAMSEGCEKPIKIPMYKIWAQMEALVDEGLVKSIGVSNFNVQLLWDMLSYCRIAPVCNEIELHPLCSQTKHLQFLKQNNIIPVAACPIGRGADTAKCPNVLGHESITSLMHKYNKTGAQIVLNWGL